MVNLAEETAEQESSYGEGNNFHSQQVYFSKRNQIIRILGNLDFFSEIPKRENMSFSMLIFGLQKEFL